MDVAFTFSSLLNAAIYLVAGVLAFAIVCRIFATVVLNPFRREIVEGQNMALAVVLGFVALAAAIVVAAAVH